MACLLYTSGFTAAEFRAAQNEGWEKQYPYKVGKKKVYMTPSDAEAVSYTHLLTGTTANTSMKCYSASSFWTSTP